VGVETSSVDVVWQGTSLDLDLTTMPEFSTFASNVAFKAFQMKKISLEKIS